MKHLFATFLLLTLFSFDTMAGVIKGIIIDKQTKEPLTGATVQIRNTNAGAVADINGNYTLHIKNGIYTLSINYIGYKPIEIKELKVGAETIVNIEMESETQTLGDVTVVAKAKKNTDLSVLTDQRRSLVVQSGVSAQQISKTQDKDASEVIRRVPGVSIIDERFVMVRGLSQRYNNVWINGSAVPSSEADSRAFSFDIIPSSQLDNMTIVKSPAPEYPADFTGGFILINTKDMPDENSFSISVGGGINDQTHFKDFRYNQGSATDILGFDNSLRPLQNGIKTSLKTFDGKAVDLLNNGFNNDWSVKSKKPIADLKLNAAYNHQWESEGGQKYGLLAALNYSNTYKTYLDMENSLFGTYDIAHDQSNYLRKSTDNQYNNDVRVGAMLNLTFIPRNSRNRYEFKNIFNQLGKNKYTSRKGFNAQSDYEESSEYYYSSRTTYNSQFTGKHTFEQAKLDWSAGYAYSNRNLPDRRKILLSDASLYGRDAMWVNTGNDISREFSRLNEHILSGNLNYMQNLTIGSLTPILKAGAYAEYRTRDYYTRYFFYNWNVSSNTLPADFQYLDPTTELLTTDNYGESKLHLFEEIKKRNNYSGNNQLYAGYAALQVPLGQLDIYAGVRVEHNNMELISNLSDTKDNKESRFYKSYDFFPSLNTCYKLNEKHQLRLSYGKSVNRPEFREVSTSVYDDFDLASPVMGNKDLKAAYIHNIDFRYEYYPSSGEMVSIALFYKRFNNPIEWTYTVTGGTELTYSYENAHRAINYGVELEIRKNLDFIGLRNLSWSFNGAWIKSEVQFAKGSLEKDRPMQGQSPYLINTGIFYQNSSIGTSAGILYNRIGKRIVGVGRSSNTTGDNNNTVPNSYEMPRNAIDLTFGQKFSKRWEVKFSIRDLLAEKVAFKQFVNVPTDSGTREQEQIVKLYQPGRNFNLSISFNL